MKPYVPHLPSQKQRHFLSLDVEEVLYGGSAGGGKSDAQLMAALQYIDVPRYSAGLFRRTMADLNKPGSILQRAHEWFRGTPAQWDEELHGYRYPTRKNQPDALLHFGYGITKRDFENRYQGTEFQYIGIDELTQWLEESYRYLFSRLRNTTDVKVPLRMRGTANPGGIGHEWVKKRFIAFALANDGCDHKELLRRRKAGEPIPDPPFFVSPPTAEAVEIGRILKRKPSNAYFVPAYAEDNPGLDVEEYRVQLAKLMPAERERLEHGNWDAAENGDFFKEEWFKYIEPDDAELEGIQWIRYWDLASTKPRPGKDPDWSAGVKMGVKLDDTGSQKVFIRHVRRFREDPGGTEKNVKLTAKNDGREVKIWLEEEPGSAGKNNTHNYSSRVLFGFNVEAHKKTGKKPEFWKPLSSAARNGLLFLVQGDWNTEFVHELCALRGDDSHAHDDQADAAGGGFAMLTTNVDAQRTIALANWGN